MPYPTPSPIQFQKHNDDVSTLLIIISIITIVLLTFAIVSEMNRRGMNCIDVIYEFIPRPPRCTTNRVSCTNRLPCIQRNMQPNIEIIVATPVIPEIIVEIPIAIQVQEN
jgi:hypothetical protein